LNIYALLAKRTTLNGEKSVEVWHMGPPVVAGPYTASQSSNKDCWPDVVGDLCLDAPECEAIEHWLAGIEKQHRSIRLKPFQQYTILPHADLPVSEERRRLPQRFSCTGFVMQAYSEAGIELLVEPNSLPEVDRECLENAYSGFLEWENRAPRIQERFGFTSLEDIGITGQGPWKIALPGYLFHATARATDDKPRPRPHQPASSDEAYFPLK